MTSVLHHSQIRPVPPSSLIKLDCGSDLTRISLCSMDCRELGIGIVPYSPIGRGFFAGRGVTQEVSSVSSLVRTELCLELIS